MAEFEQSKLLFCVLCYKTSNLFCLLMFLISVPPEKPVIFDKIGNVVTDLIGPIQEGSDLILTCEVSGGE